MEAKMKIKVFFIFIGPVCEFENQVVTEFSMIQIDQVDMRLPDR